MSNSQITEGDLLAYLDGVRLTQVEEALRVSPALQQELAELRATQAWLQHNLGALARPDPQDLVDVVTDQATAQQKLIVAAYVRSSARGQREFAALEKEFAALQPPRKQTSRLPFFRAIPVVGVALRSTDEPQAFQVTDLQAQVTLRIAPPVREQWQIEGYVTQHLQPLAQAKVTLHSEGIHPRRRTTDFMGFFTFRRLATGVYTLRIQVAQGVMIVEGIELKEMG